MIEFQNICKTYRVAKRQAGFTNAVKSLFSREYETIHALDDVSFRITTAAQCSDSVPSSGGTCRQSTVSSSCGICTRPMTSCTGRIWTSLPGAAPTISESMKMKESKANQLTISLDPHILPVSTAIAGFASQTELLDVSVTDISTEEVVAALYKEYHI